MNPRPALTPSYDPRGVVCAYPARPVPTFELLEMSTTVVGLPSWISEGSEFSADALESQSNVSGEHNGCDGAANAGEDRMVGATQATPTPTPALVRTDRRDHVLASALDST